MLLKTLLKRRTWDHLKCGKDIMDMFVNRSYNSLLNLILLLKVYITNVKKYINERTRTSRLFNYYQMLVFERHQ